MMTRRKLENLRDMVELPESPMARVSLDDLANPERIRKRLSTELELHIRSKKGMGDLVSRIQRAAQIDANRAKRIAVTEKTRTLNSARMQPSVEQYLKEYDKAVKGHRKRPELPRFQWVHTNAAREPRPRHIALSGTVRAIGEEFLPGVRFPGDPDGPAAEIINCHCYIRKAR